MDNITTRPTPLGVAPSGRPLYDPEEVAAYRKSLAITQSDVAATLKVTQVTVVKWERGDLDDPRLDEELAAIDRIAARRERMIVWGVAELAELRIKCRANVGERRFKRCGEPVIPGLVVCIAHEDQHDALVDGFAHEWIRTREARVRSASRRGSAAPRRPSPSTPEA